MLSDEPNSADASPSVWRRLAKNGAQTLAVVGALALGLVIGGAGHEPSATPPPSEPAAAGAVWTCAMHPQIRMEAQGQCPICGMELVPGDAGGAEGGGAAAGRVQLSPDAQALATIQTALVVRTEPRAEVRLLGRVDYDEERLRMVTPWTDGRIDKLLVRVTGATVRKGQVVASLYSPEVYAAMRDLVVGIEQAAKLSKGMHGSGDLAAAAVAAGREKLRLLGVSASQIETIERTRETPKDVPIRSSYTGTVIRRNVEEGDYVKAGTALYHIADLSRVWVQIDAYESDLPHLALDQAVTIEIEALPGEHFEGTVSFIDPVIDKKTRTARVRVEVANDEGELRPGMFAQAVVQGDVGSQTSYLVIPSTAPLFTGRRSVVYVAVPGQPGAYELREVRLGALAGPVFPVLWGLAEGETVVTRGAFVLDADLQLHGGPSMMTRSDDGQAPPFVATAAMLAELAPVVDAYLEAQAALAQDDFEAVHVRLEAFTEATNKVTMSGPRAARQAWQPIASALSGHGRHAATATGHGEIRAAFEDISDQLVALLHTFGNPSQSSLNIAFCPMAFDDRGAQWVQGDGPVANPYYGAAMLRCGEFKATLFPGERLAPSQGQGDDAAERSGTR